jgi:hypothetical protein
MEKYGDKPTGDIEAERTAAKDASGDEKQDVQNTEGKADKSAAPITITEKLVAN